MKKRIIKKLNQESITRLQLKRQIIRNKGLKAETIKMFFGLPLNKYINNEEGS